MFRILGLPANKSQLNGSHIKIHQIYMCAARQYFTAHNSDAAGNTSWTRRNNIQATIGLGLVY